MRTVADVCDAEFAALLDEADRRANALISRERHLSAMARSERRLMAWCWVGFFALIVLGFAL